MSVLDPPRTAPGLPDDPWRAEPAPRRPVVKRLWRGPEADPAWVRPALFALLGATALLYLWDLGASGWANSFYAAAVQAGTKSGKAAFFGSFDSSNFITVDKTPASLWVMEISARIFGVNAWSLLVPQALEGVAAVGILFATIKRWFSPAAALLAGAVFALTPMAALMFRFNNPDALLVLLLVASAYAFTRALERGELGWMLAAGALVGFGFLAKELQAFLVLPGYGLVYLLAGPPRLARRVGHVIALGLATLVAAGWWVAIVELWPASSRPYIGGSQNNSFWNVLFGYNGFGRLTGNERGSVVGAPVAAGGRSLWGPTGFTRMFNSSFGGQISWLLPAALILLVVGLAFTALRPRTDRTRTALLLWGSWLLVTGLAFSLGQGIIHPYYTIALAPAIGAIVGIGTTMLWARRHNLFARLSLGATIAVTGWWAYTLLQRTPGWTPLLRSIVLVSGIITGLIVAASPAVRGRIGVALVLVATAIGLAAPAAYTLSTVRTPRTGAIPSAGPSAGGQFGGRAPGGRRFNFGSRQSPNFPNFGNGTPGGGLPNFGNGPPGGFPNFGNGTPGGGRGGFPGFGNGNGIGGLLNGSKPGAQVTALLKNSGKYRWAAAAIGANNAAGYQLASNKAIMAIGGFNGTDPTPTLDQFEQYVSKHEVRYFIGGGIGGFPGGGSSNASTSSQITQWVASNFSSQSVDGVTIYDLAPASNGGLS